MIGKKLGVWGGALLGVIAAGVVLFAFDNPPSMSLFRGSTSQSREAAANAKLTEVQIEAEEQTKPSDSTDVAVTPNGPASSDSTDAYDAVQPSTDAASTATPDADATGVSADAANTGITADASNSDETNTDESDAEKSADATDLSDAVTPLPGVQVATAGGASKSGNKEDLTDPLDDGTPLDDPLANTAPLDVDHPILAADDRPVTIGDEPSPHALTDHSHWLKGSIFNARVTVILDGVKLGDFQSSQDKDITWKLKKGLNTVTFVYTPLVKSASAHLDVLESEHDPPIPPLATFRSTALTRLPGATQNNKKADTEPVSRTFAFVAR
jgi:hypothetical protein